MAKQRFTSPVGRLVQGSVDEPQTKDAQGNLRVVKTGPNVGQPNPQYFIGVAFAKADPQGEFAAFYGTLVAQAAADFPNLFPNGPTGACVHPSFAFKVIDGDGNDTTGKSNATKEGFAGHWVVRFASSYPPRCFHAGRYAANEQIQEKGAIKRGYFVRVNGTVEGNGNAQRPGLYVNLDMVELAAYGPEIVSGPDAGQAFGAGPAALPAGATAAPMTPAAGAPPLPGAAPSPAAGLPVPAAHDPMAAAVGDGWTAHPTSPGWFYKGAEVLSAADVAARYPAPLAAPPVAAPPAPPVAPASPTSAPVVPYTGFMQPPATGTAGLPPVPGAPVVAPPVPSPAAPPPPVPIASPSSGPVMLPAANGATYEALRAAGWTDDLLRQHAMIV